MSQVASGLWRWTDSVDPIRDLLDRGGILVVPTESSYGLAVDPRNRKGVEAVYRCKGRERDIPLPVVLADIEQLERLGGDPADEVLRCLAVAWPAPLTLVVDLLDEIPATGGLMTLGIRVPRHPRLRALLSELEMGLTATSANRSGREPVLDPTDAVNLMRGCDALVVDDGVLPGGPPSTVVRFDTNGLTVLRRGSYPLEKIESLLADGRRTRSFSADVAENLVDDRRRDR